MDYSTPKKAVYFLLSTILLLIANTTKEEFVIVFLDNKNSSSSEVQQAIIFVLSFTILIALVINALYEVLKKEKRKKKDLYPFFKKKEVEEKIQHYIPTKIQSQSPAKLEEPIDSNAIHPKAEAIPFFINEVFNAEEPQYYLVLGGSGMGKSTFLLKLYLTYINKWKQRYNIILIPLNNLDGLESIDKLELEQQRNTILLLDALDEDIAAQRNYRDRLEKIASKTWKFRKVIITSRTQFFPNQGEEPVEIVITKKNGKGVYNIEKTYISPFSIRDCKNFLHKKYGWLPSINKKKAIRILSDATKVMVRPMLLSKIDDLVKANINYNRIYQIYETITESWIEREGEKQMVGKKDKAEFKKHLSTFSQKLAILTYQEQKRTMRPLLDKEAISELAALLNYYCFYCPKKQ